MSARKPRPNGKHASVPTTTPSLPSTTSVGLSHPLLKKLLAAIYDRYQKLDAPAANKACRHDFVFHMTDWAADLRRLAALYANPQQFDRATAGDIVAGFLLHALPHLMEAGRLLLDYEPDYIFESPKPKGTRLKPGSKSRRPGPSPSPR